MAEGPDRSFGPALKEAIAVRGIAMALAGAGGYFAGRVTGTIQRARTITLLSMVGAQLGQTAIARPRDPVVVGGSLAAAALLLGIVETPWVSAVFGCQPVGPAGLAIAGTAATVGTVATLLLPAVLRKVKAFATDEATVEDDTPLASVAPTPALTVQIDSEQVAREREVVTVGLDCRRPRRSGGTRGRSSMVESQSSKLATRVRFPSPAPLTSDFAGQLDLRRSNVT